MPVPTARRRDSVSSFESLSPLPSDGWSDMSSVWSDSEDAGSDDDEEMMDEDGPMIVKLRYVRSRSPSLSESELTDATAEGEPDPEYSTESTASSSQLPTPEPHDAHTPEFIALKQRVDTALRFQSDAQVVLSYRRKQAARLETECQTLRESLNEVMLAKGRRDDEVLGFRKGVDYGYGRKTRGMKTQGVQKREVAGRSGRGADEDQAMEPASGDEGEDEDEEMDAAEPDL